MQYAVFLQDGDLREKIIQNGKRAIEKKFFSANFY
jgi:hypothetical protein